MKILITHYETVNGEASKRHPYIKQVDVKSLNSLEMELHPIRQKLKQKHGCDEVNLIRVILNPK